MARRTVVDCDGCGKQNLIKSGLVCVKTGTQVGVQGSEDRCEDLDLCADCLARKLEKLLHMHTKFDDEFRKTWLQTNKKQNSLPQS